MNDIKIINDFLDLIVINQAPACTCTVSGKDLDIVTSRLVYIEVKPGK